MADEQGHVTIRDAQGNVVLADRTLLLPDGWREDESFCRFQNGLIRTVSASFSDSGVLLSRSDEIISSEGNVFSLPEGYRATGYKEGAFVVTNGVNTGFYAVEGAWIGTPSYRFATPFREGLATVEGEEGKEGLLSRQGKEILAPSFDEIDVFYGGLAVLRDEFLGQVLLWKVEGQYPPPGEETSAPNDRSYYERVPLSRGPKNTFDDGNDIIIVFPEIEDVPWEKGGKATQKPVYTVPVDTGRTDPPPSVTDTDPAETDPGSSVPNGSEPGGSETPASSSTTEPSAPPVEGNEP